jgi:hypothetical protein
MQKAVAQPIANLGEISPDGRWITGWSSYPGNEGTGWQAFSLEGLPQVLIANGINWHWSPRGDSISVSDNPIPGDRTYVIPVAPGEVFPPMPAGGFHSEGEVAALPGARKIDVVAVPGPSPDVFAFYRTTTQRNLYRIPIR